MEIECKCGRIININSNCKCEYDESKEHSAENYLKEMNESKEENNCYTCTGNGSQSIYPSQCTGCFSIDGNQKNYKPNICKNCLEFVDNRKICECKSKEEIIQITEKQAREMVNNRAVFDGIYVDRVIEFWKEKNYILPEKSKLEEARELYNKFQTIINSSKVKEFVNLYEQAIKELEKKINKI